MKKLITALAITGLPLVSNTSHGVGLQLMPGSPNFGTAGAGHAAAGLGAGSAWANPATMTLTKEQNIGVGLIAAETDLQFKASDDADNSGSNAGGSLLIPSFAYSNAISDSLSLGFSFVVPFGSEIEYQDDWAGANVATSASTQTLQAMPALAYRFNEHFSMGFGVTANETSVHQELKMTMGTPRNPIEMGVELEAEGIAYGWTMGTLYEINQDNRIGVVYRSQVDTDLEGDGTLSGTQYDTSLNWENPASIVISGFHRLNDDFSLLWDLGRTYYSAFETTNVTVEDMPIPGLDNIELDRHWQDANRYAIGTHYQLSEDIILQAGFSLDKSPVSKADRSVDLPLDDIKRYTLGTLYQLNSSVGLGFGLEYADLGDAETQTSDDPLFASPAGSYDNSAIAASFSMNYQF